MQELAPRIDSVKADIPASTRIVSAVSPVTPTAASAGSASDAGVGADSGDEARRQHMASAADYARVHARIAQILAKMGSGGGAQMQSSANEQMSAMLPQSTIVIPLPPASAELMERAMMLARDMAREAELTRGSYAGINSGVVSQVVSNPA